MAAYNNRVASHLGKFHNSKIHFMSKLDSSTTEIEIYIHPKPNSSVAFNATGLTAATVVAYAFVSEAFRTETLVYVAAIVPLGGPSAWMVIGNKFHTVNNTYDSPSSQTSCVFCHPLDYVVLEGSRQCHHQCCHQVCFSSRNSVAIRVVNILGTNFLSFSAWQLNNFDKTGAISGNMIAMVLQITNILVKFKFICSRMTSAPGVNVHEVEWGRKP